MQCVYLLLYLGYLCQMILRALLLICLSASNSLASENYIILGKGIYNKETGETLQLACIDESCEQVQFVYGSATQEKKFVGQAQKTVSSFLSLEDAVKNKLRNDVDVYGKHYFPTNANSLIEQLQWEPDAFKNPKTFVSQKAITALKNKQQINWQFKPKKSSNSEFKQLYSLITHAPLPSQIKRPHCELRKVVFDGYKPGGLLWMHQDNAQFVFFENQNLSTPWQQKAGLILNYHNSNLLESAADFLAAKYIEQKAWAYFDPAPAVENPHHDQAIQITVSYSAKAFREKYVSSPIPGQSKVKYNLGKQCVIAEINTGTYVQVKHCDEPHTDIITPAIYKLARQVGCL